MAVSVTGPRAVNELGGPVIPGNFHVYDLEKYLWIFKVTLNHENNIRNGLYSQNYTKKMHYTRSYIYLLKKSFFPMIFFIWQRHFGRHLGLALFALIISFDF